MTVGFRWSACRRRRPLPAPSTRAPTISIESTASLVPGAVKWYRAACAHPARSPSLVGTRCHGPGTSEVSSGRLPGRSIQHAGADGTGYGTVPASPSDDAVALRPAEPVLGAPPRLVFTTHESRIIATIKHIEDRRIVHLAFVGLRPRRHRCDLDMTDDRMIARKPRHQVAALDLGMIEIELHAHIGPADLRDDAGGLLGPVQEIVGPVAAVDWLDQDTDAVVAGKVGCARDVGDKDLLALGLPLRGHLAGQAMDGGGADPDR